MEKRELGNTGIHVSLLGFGCSPLGNEFGEIDERGGIAAVHSALDKGVNYFDVSPYYGRGKAESVLGRALKSSGKARDEYVVSTKVGRYDVDTFDFSAERVTKSVDESLERLQLEYIDVILCHDVEFAEDIDIIINETIPALDRLKNLGKVRAIGITGYPIEIFPYLLTSKVGHIVDVILSYGNLNLQNNRLLNIMRDIIENKKHVGIINASVLCMGLLTGSKVPNWHPASHKVKEAAVDVAKYCEEKKLVVADEALKYALGFGDICSTLVGIGDVDTLEKNLAVVNSITNDNDNDKRMDDGAVVREIIEVFRKNKAHNVRWNSGKFLGNN